MTFLNGLELLRYSQRASQLVKRLELSCLGNADSGDLQVPFSSTALSMANFWKEKRKPSPFKM